MSLRWICATMMSLAACGGGDAASATAMSSESFAGAPLARSLTASGSLTIELRTSPQPLTRGEAKLQLLIREAAQGTPAAGLQVAILPWMPAMGHGSAIKPDVIETAPGIYLASHVELFMAGTWDLRTKLSGPLQDEVEFTVEVP